MSVHRGCNKPDSELDTSCAKLLVGKLLLILIVAEGGTELLLGRL
jgi:hypothetical protein